MTGRAILFANGQFSRPRAAGRLVRQGDYLVAVDGGLYAMRRAGLQPHLLVGDLDSVEAADVAAVQAAGCEVRRFPVQKDETDLELALQMVAERGFAQARVLAALGGRLDQMLGNLFLLANPAWAGMDVRILDAGLEVFLIREQAQIEGRAGETVSLLPWNGPAQGVRTSGLAYPLAGETLFAERTRGVSNHLLAKSATISLQSGLLLCVHLFAPSRRRK